ncbi:leucine rich adaptor protein 1-like [Diretmus argenteus]
MAERPLNDSSPDLLELENKIGMKTPESLLIWMKDAAHYEDCWSGDAAESRDPPAGDSFSDKIRNLKQEMRWLRSADVRILRQLVAVHEGIEAVRWLMEERGTLASRGSSLTSSQSSLVTVEGPGPSMSPCRGSPSLICLQDPDIGEESAEPADNNSSNCGSYLDKLSREATEASPPSPSGSKFEVTCSTRGRHGQPWSSPATANSLVSANLLKLQPQVSKASPLQDVKTSAEPIRRALVRANTAGRKGLKGGGGSSTLPKLGSLRACKRDEMEEEQSAPSRDEMLLGYDAQWRWVESQDDVTFL